MKYFKPIPGQIKVAASMGVNQLKRANFGGLCWFIDRLPLSPF